MLFKALLVVSSPIFTKVYNSTGGSLLAMVVMHAMGNFAGALAYDSMKIIDASRSNLMQIPLAGIIVPILVLAYGSSTLSARHAKHLKANQKLIREKASHA